MLNKENKRQQLNVNLKYSADVESIRTEFEFALLANFAVVLDLLTLLNKYNIYISSVKNKTKHRDCRI